MKEIGGYIEFEHYHNPMLHENAVKLNCGRSGLVYLIKARKIKRIAIPYFQGGSVVNACRRYGVDVRYYHIDTGFLPERFEILDDEWLLLVNYYGQLTREHILGLLKNYRRVILDNTQAYFDMPLPGVDTIYSCRKFFGVPDGGILYTDVHLKEELSQDESMDRIRYLMGRFERSASEFYASSTENERRFDTEPIKKMSRLTENLLRAVDYEFVRDRRTDNYLFLHERLGEHNLLDVRKAEGAFAYPLMLEDGNTVRKKLISNKVYVPTLWPTVIDTMSEDSLEYRLAMNILPLPCDQRYDKGDMRIICDLIENDIRERS